MRVLCVEPRWRVLGFTPEKANYIDSAYYEATTIQSTSGITGMVELHDLSQEAASAWKLNDFTWNNVDAYWNAIKDARTPVSVSVPTSNPTTLKWDMTDMFKFWITAGYGQNGDMSRTFFMLKMGTETTT